MLGILVLFASAIAAVIAGFFIFKSNDMVHAIIAFAVVAVAISLLMLVMQLPILALLQLFIMVGGVSTYLFVGASSEQLSKFKHTNLLLLVTLSFIVAIPLIYWFGPTASGSSSNLLTSSAINLSITSDLPLFYLIAILLFGVGISSVILMKKLVANK